MPPTRLRLVILFAALALLAGWAPGALADVDPASDVLPLQNVFLPYKPKVCSELSSALRKLTFTSKKTGYPVKVAVIGSKSDLGGAAYLFGKPQSYAGFLAQELVTFSPDFGTVYANQALLVAMPGGFGLDHGGAKSERALKELSVPSGAKPNELVRASLNAIPKLARASGHSVVAPKVGSSCSESGGTSVLIFIAPIAVLLLGGILVGSRSRLRRSEA
jgi:hypothetical protein